METTRPSAESLLRRGLDVALALTLLVLLLPVFLAVALLVAATSRGPVFYRQKRVGRGGRLFGIRKFRTMIAHADRLGPAMTSADDTRVTRVGRFLRHSKLDELPQLWNVVQGDMSLVGPRPQVPSLVDRFDPALRNVVLRVRPGITGPTALTFRHEESLLADRANREQFYVERILPVKLEMDARYVQSRTLSGDLRVLAQTAWAFSLAPLSRALTATGRRRHRGPAAKRAGTDAEEALGAAR